MEELFGGIFQNKNVFLTGHTGFKGSWLALWLTGMGARVTGYSRAPNTNPSHFELLNLEMDSVTGELLDTAALNNSMQKARPDVVFHLAAQPLVRDSYEQPLETYNSNVIGTLNVCEAARQCDSVKAIVVITTDKVYENREWHWGYREIDPLGGYDPYSASKACAEILLASYRHSFFHPAAFGKTHDVLLATARAGNVIGGGDWSKDRLIPDIMKATARGEKTVIRNPKATRPWQHVLECLSGYLFLGQKLLEKNMSMATSFNFGPPEKDEFSVGNLGELVKQNWPAAVFEFPELRGEPHEAGLLKLDCSRARIQLGWEPLWEANTAVERTVSWYRAYYEKDKVESRRDLQDYIARARSLKAAWA